MQYKSGGLSYENKADFERAKKEEEIIRFMKADKKLKKPEEALKIYNTLVLKKSFVSVPGYIFMTELRNYILKSGIVQEDGINPVPVVSRSKAEGKQEDAAGHRLSGEMAGKAEGNGTEKKQGSKEPGENKKGKTGRSETEKYQLLYEREKTICIKNRIVIAFLSLAVIVMLVLAYSGQLSKKSDEVYRTEIENEYAAWQEELSQKEQKLKEREELIEEKLAIKER